MIVRRFLLWARTASAQQRAEGVRVLAQAYLDSPMSPADRAEAETAFLALTHDPSPLVRRALAEVLAPAPQTPRSLVVSLVAEPGEIAAMLLRHSPRLSDEELVDAAAIGDAQAQCAVASRENVSAGVAAAMAEVGCRAAAMALLENPGAEMLPSAFERLIDRFGDDPELREALLAREDLPSDLRQNIAAKVAESLAAFVTDCGWLTPERAERVKRDSTERVAVDLAAQGAAYEIMALIRRLRIEARLTPALMLRSLLFAEPALAEAAFAELTGLPLERTTLLMYDRRASGFSALYRRAKLPESLQDVFSVAVSTLAEARARTNGQSRLRLARMMLDRAIGLCERNGNAGGVLALMRRFEADCAREEAQALAESLADDAALMLVIEADPSLLVEDMGGPAGERLARLAA